MGHSKQDPSAILEAAYEAYADAIFRHCYYRTFNRERGKELMQETFLRTWEYLKRGKQIDNIRAFLYRIANNLIIDDARRKKEVSLDGLGELGFDPPGDDGSSAIREMEDKRVLSILSKLPKESRELIIMRYINDLKPQDIGAIFDLPANTVSVRLHRAMKELKTLLEPL